MTHRRYLSMTTAALAYAVAGAARHAQPTQGVPGVAKAGDLARTAEPCLPRPCYADDPKSRDTWRPRNRIRARARTR